MRAVVLMGQGASFSAGADIEHMRKSAQFSKEQNRKAALASAQMFHTLHTLRKPTIARVHGAVRGGGVGLVAACDIAIGSRDATFRLSEVRLGIIPAMIGPYVVAAIGERHARRYFVSGEEFDAAEAYRIGLLHDIVEPGDLNARIGDMLSQVYCGGPHAIVAAKRQISLVAHAGITEVVVAATADAIADIRATSEAQERPDGISGKTQGVVDRTGTAKEDENTKALATDSTEFTQTKQTRDYVLPLLCDLCAQWHYSKRRS